MHPTGVIGGVAAAAVWGSTHTTTDAAVEVHLGASGGRAQPGLHVRREYLRGDERTVVDGLPVTTPARTALDLARRLPLVEAVAAIDALVRVTMLRVEDVRAAAAQQAGARDVRVVKRVLALVDPRSSSPMWSRVRVALALRGVVCPAVGYWLLDDDGEPTARFELAWPDVRYAITAEQKGPPAAPPDLPGWTVRRIDPALVVDRADALATRAVRGIRAARRRRGRPGGAATLTKPWRGG